MRDTPAPCLAPQPSTGSPRGQGPRVPRRREGGRRGRREALAGAHRPRCSQALKSPRRRSRALADAKKIEHALLSLTRVVLVVGGDAQLHSSLAQPAAAAEGAGGRGTGGRSVSALLAGGPCWRCWPAAQAEVDNWAAVAAVGWQRPSCRRLSLPTSRRRRTCSLIASKGCTRAPAAAPGTPVCVTRSCAVKRTVKTKRQSPPPLPPT